MKRSYDGIWDLDRGQPPTIAGVIGLRVCKAWVLDEGSLFLVRFEGGMVMHTDAVKGVGMEALELTVGPEVENAGWDELLKDKPSVPALVGRRFTGMEQNVLTFGKVGVRISAEAGVQLVRQL